ncbi:unnamed protein product [Rhizophagus irregularis]|nr:unnamed protein product [Rhizophagus irregularis]CAB4431893.1 unnamed protein product [Rhizophagus irregularis]
MQESIKNLDKYLGNIVIEVIKIGKEIKELKDQYENKYKDIPDKNYKRNERPTCYWCNNKGHYSINCKVKGRNAVKRKNNTCENCGGKGNFTKDCTSDRIERDQMICYRCNKMGHYAKDCQVEIKIIKRKDNKCKNCSKKGHYTKGCLNGQSKENNNDRIDINKNDEDRNPDQKNMRSKKLYIGDDYVTIKNKIYDENIKDQRI